MMQDGKWHGPKSLHAFKTKHRAGRSGYCRTIKELPLVDHPPVFMGVRMVSVMEVLQGEMELTNCAAFTAFRLEAAMTWLFYVSTSPADSFHPFEMISPTMPPPSTGVLSNAPPEPELHCFAGRRRPVTSCSSPPPLSNVCSYCPSYKDWWILLFNTNSHNDQKFPDGLHFAVSAWNCRDDGYNLPDPTKWTLINVWEFRNKHRSHVERLPLREHPRVHLSSRGQN